MVLLTDVSEELNSSYTVKVMDLFLKHVFIVNPIGLVSSHL